LGGHFGNTDEEANDDSDGDNGGLQMSACSKGGKEIVNFVQLTSNEDVLESYIPMGEEEKNVEL
jgi:hypothetical protein